MNIDDSAVRRKPPSAVIRGRQQMFLEFTTNRFVPGPGQYDAKDIKFRSTSFAFGNPQDLKSKSKLKLNDTPGPGAYTISFRKKLIWNICLPETYCKVRDDFGIGAKAVSILGRHDEGLNRKEKLNFSPGPGSYNVEKFNKTTGPMFSLKGAVSEDPIMREK